EVPPPFVGDVIDALFQAGASVLDALGGAVRLPPAADAPSPATPPGEEGGARPGGPEPGLGLPNGAEDDARSLTTSLAAGLLASALCRGRGAAGDSPNQTGRRPRGRRGTGW